MAHAGRGDEAIGGADSHVFLWEAGGMAALGGVVPCPLPTDRYGRMDPAEVQASFRPDDPHLPTTRMILLENSYGNRNGYPLREEYFASITAVALERFLPIHMDGARLFNAAIDLDINENWSIGIWGQNLGDEEYRGMRGVSFLGIPFSLYMQPRTYGVEAAYRF